MLINAKEVVALTTLARPTIRQLVAEGTFPKPVRVSTRRWAWSKAEVEGWVKTVLASREGSKKKRGRPKKPPAA